MIEKKDILFALIGIFFTLSAISTGISQSYETKATRNLINPIIDFEKSDYFSNYQLASWELANMNLINENKQYLINNWFCSFVTLYKDQPNLDKEIFNQSINNCLDFPKHSIDVNKLMNASEMLDNFTKSIQPLNSLTDNFKEFYSNNQTSMYLQLASLAMFLLGVLVFIYCFLEYKLEKCERVKK